MKNWIRGTNATVLSLAVIGIFIVLTVVLHSAKGLQWDFTQTKKFTLSQQTITLLADLKEPVHAVSFNDPQDPGDSIMRMQINDMLEAYHKRNAKFTYEEINAVQQPSAVDRYKLTQLGVVLFQQGDKTKNVDRTTLFNAGSSGGTYAFGGEEKFTQAIKSLSSNVKHKMYLLEGHGELTAATVSQWNAGMGKEDYAVQSWNSVTGGDLPADADAVAVLQPSQDLSDKELTALQTYVKGNGKLLLAFGPKLDMAKWKNWNALVNGLGVKVEPTVVLGGKNRLPNDIFTIAPDYSPHAVTTILQQQNRRVLVAGSLSLAPTQGAGDYDVAALLQAAEDTYGKTDLALLLSGKATQADINQKNDDPKGPFALGYAVTDKSGKPKAVVLGSAALLSDGMMDYQQGNMDFALNSVGWLQEQKGAITIRPREEKAVTNVMAQLTPSARRFIWSSTLIGIPLVFLLVGGFVWWRRRKG